MYVTNVPLLLFNWTLPKDVHSAIAAGIGPSNFLSFKSTMLLGDIVWGELWGKEAGLQETWGDCWGWCEVTEAPGASLHTTSTQSPQISLQPSILSMEWSTQISKLRQRPGPDQRIWFRPNRYSAAMSTWKHSEELLRRWSDFLPSPTSPAASRRPRHQGVVQIGRFQMPLLQQWFKSLCSLRSCGLGRDSLTEQQPKSVPPEVGSGLKSDLNRGCPQARRYYHCF